MLFLCTINLFIFRKWHLNRNALLLVGGNIAELIPLMNLLLVGKLFFVLTHLIFSLFRRPTSPNPQVNWSRLQEKEQLSNLNDRLATYIDVSFSYSMTSLISFLFRRYALWKLKMLVFMSKSKKSK